MSDKLSVSQTRVVDEAEAYLRQAFASARKGFVEAGISFDNDAHFECLRCDGCNGFERGGPPKFLCRNPGCGHSIFQHNMPA